MFDQELREAFGGREATTGSAVWTAGGKVVRVWGLDVRPGAAGGVQVAITGCAISGFGP